MRGERRVASKITHKLVDDHRMCLASLSLMNEFGQIAAAYFVETKSLDEIAGALQRLAARYPVGQVIICNDTVAQARLATAKQQGE